VVCIGWPDDDGTGSRAALIAVAVVSLMVSGGCRAGDETEQVGGGEATLSRAAADAGLALDLDALRKGQPFNVVLISLDTTRADHIGAYGFKRIATPAIDSLAAEGVLFERAYTPAPLTFPAHASLLSGTYPFAHGVRDNVGFMVPDEITTAAEIFRGQGYQTAAFIGSMVLDGRWGLDQGFDTYFDDFGFDARAAELMNEVQRPANEVIDNALAWMD